MKFGIRISSSSSSPVITLEKIKFRVQHKKIKNYQLAESHLCILQPVLSAPSPPQLYLMQVFPYLPTQLELSDQG